MSPGTQSSVVLLGLGVGAILAHLSRRGGSSSEAAATPPLRRLAFTLGCAATAGWSMIVQPGPTGILGAVLGWQLLLLAVLDFERLWLPLPLTIGLIVSGLAAGWAADVLPERVVGAAAGYLSLAVVAIAYRRLRGREGLGGGDAWLLAGGGAWVGWTGLPTILVWAAGGGLAAVAVLAATGRRIGRDQPLPFGAALALGIWLAWLYGPIGRA